MPAQYVTGNNKESRNQTFQGNGAVLSKPMHPVAENGGLPVSSSLPNAIQKNAIETEEEEQVDMKTESEGMIQLMGNPAGDDEHNQDAIQLSGGNGDSYASSGIESGINRSKGGGNPLPGGMATEMGRKIGADFSKVRTHTDQNAIQMNQELGANAFAHGNDIYFNKNQYNPSSPDGKRLLAHELTHTVQQNANSISRDANTPQIQKQDSARKKFKKVLAGNPAELISKTERSKLKFTQGLTKSMDQWSARYIEITLKNLENEDKKADWADMEVRLQKLVKFRAKLSKVLKANIDKGDDVLTLANIIYNEGGVLGENVHRAVAYAWLNRTGGTVSANRGKELSDYKRLNDRWNGFDDNNKLTFMQHFPSSVEAAAELINMDPAKRKKTDPTQGATHWVSPVGLKTYNPKSSIHKKERYKRTEGSQKDKAFPIWAIKNSDKTRLETARKKGHIGPDYEEIKVKGIPREKFLFYRDVRYKR